MKSIEHYLKPGAIVPVNNETTKALVDALKEAREALAQPERHELQAKGEHPAPCARHCEATAFQIEIRRLKAKLAQPKQEPVAWANPHDLQNFDMKVRISGGPLHTVPLYTTPPQKPWIGLTDEEILKEIPVTGHIPITSFARAIEAKLKAKNFASSEGFKEKNT